MGLRRKRKKEEKAILVRRPARVGTPGAEVEDEDKTGEVSTGRYREKLIS